MKDTKSQNEIGYNLFYLTKPECDTISQNTGKFMHGSTQINTLTDVVYPDRTIVLRSWRMRTRHSDVTYCTALCSHRKL